MKIGAHVSAAGGLWNAPLNAKALELECFQFFSRPPQGGKVKPLEKDVIEKFLSTCQDFKFDEYYIHTPYVINLASEKAHTRSNSINIIRGELDRGALLKARAIMTHVGSATGVGEEAGVKFVAEGIKKIMAGYKGETKFLIEISAGAGMVIGDTFEEIKQIMDLVGDSRIGICFDTAHAFASGYDLRTAANVAATFKKFDDIIGLDKLVISHCNDSKIPLGEHKDRHDHLGHGHIGIDGFKAIVKSPVFKNVNLILETPVDDVKSDIEILKKLRGKNP